MERFNKLSPAEDERLSLLLEEMGEAIQIIGKIKRHGYASSNPDSSSRATNRDLLVEEIGHVCYAVLLLTEARDVPALDIDDATLYKARRVVEYLHHQDAKILDRLLTNLCEAKEAKDDR